MRRNPALAPWQRVYSTPGEALDALLRWRPVLEAEARPERYAVAEVPGRPGEWMLALGYPAGTVLEVFEDSLREWESVGGNVDRYLGNTLEESLAGRAEHANE